MESIKCPNCNHVFEPTDTIRDEVERELRSKMITWQKEKEKQFSEEKNKLLKETEESLRKNIAGDFENKLRLLEQNNKLNEEKLRLSREKELDFLRKEQELQTKEKELEIEIQKVLLAERSKLSETIRKEESERNSLKETEFQLKMKEMEEKLEAQKKLAEEMKRRAEQGLTQSQGEVQELLLEEMLRTSFPFDLVEEVGKGVKGADCIQTVRNSVGQDCGKIIYESKRTKEFVNDWIDKLKHDMRSQAADVAILVTQTFPRGMTSFGERNGIWICGYAEARAVAFLLRDSLIRVANASRNEENRGDKMHMLYGYLTSNEFAEQWKAIREGFMSMRLSIQKERDMMEKIWKAREKQLEKVLLNAAHIKGSVEGIAGQDSVDLNLLESGEESEA